MSYLMLRRVVSQKLTDVSEVLTASVIRASLSPLHKWTVADMNEKRFRFPMLNVIFASH
jgi:hypothetical protein